jgi:hypothetical protein
MSGSGNVNATVALQTPPTTQVDLGLDDIGVTFSGREPIVLQTTTDLTISKPVTANVNGTVDIKPLVFDLRVSLGKIVPAYVRLPYRHHFGFTLFGFELVGFTLHGESQISVEDTPPPPP